MNLKTFQEKILNMITDSTSTTNEALDLIRDDKGISNQHRLNSYKRSFNSRLLSTINDDFEVTKHFLKTDDFPAYIKNYLQTHPPTHHYINDVSRQLPNYIEENMPDQAAPFILDIAKLEWLMIKSFYDFFNYKATKKLSDTGTKVTTNPSLKLFKSPWPLDKIWNHVEAHERTPSHLSVWTLDDRIVRIESWTELEYKVLKAFQNHSTLETVIEKVENEASTEELTRLFSQKLNEWVQLGLLKVEAELDN